MNHSFTWQGRHDGDGEEHRRIHHVVNTTQHASFALIGFGSDEGVKRNKGRLGAADAPDMIRAQLANLPVHQSVSIVDIGTVVCEQGQLEKAQAELADQVERSLQQGMKPIVLGGGHEVAFGSFSGLFQYIQHHEPQQKIGIINFDAHFDLREAEQVTSGTPFLNAAKLSEQNQKEFHYLCIGVAKHSNTKALFDTADRLNCQYIYDQQLQLSEIDHLISKINGFIEKIDALYITVDLDVFNASIAPGVSAPAVKGIDLSVFDPLFQAIKKSGKIRVFDVAECNPRFDLDNRTAKLAAYIIFNYIFD
ncbi:MULTISPECIES: formimidoylglutamase [Acinetobacter]|jgi:formiminoglutamase|uniref:formimidoylglutamase n=1 Tax=Acinetobacter TaxID=469 RepID=UPI0005B53FB8|nr:MULTISPECIES: formimidoylglutamase [Acinetobacter]APU48494.1 formimidoylglutamase [Acinetobacter junii]MDH1005333.1 formimidoylglutamase [Acinetobacter junii]MDH1916878.1 formimidoylglutamase [Acinetobacter junii]MQZ58132.1 formimidoylglutamase [Acinetobacter junii]QQV65954.1 Formimidoylglutamase [Acinetobacter junii]